MLMRFFEYTRSRGGMPEVTASGQRGLMNHGTFIPLSPAEYETTRSRMIWAGVVLFVSLVGCFVALWKAAHIIRDAQNGGALR